MCMAETVEVFPKDTPKNKIMLGIIIKCIDYKQINFTLPSTDKAPEPIIRVDEKL